MRNNAVQMWNNAAFDSIENIIMDSFSSSKENLSPEGPNVNSKIHFKSSEVRYENEIDKEIEDIQMHIKRLSSRLEDLQKAKKILKIPENILLMEKNPKEDKKISLTISGSRTRRGFSLGPTDIVSATPVQPMQNRRKSCFWKLDDNIDEGKEVRQAVTTIGSNKYVKKDDGVLNSVQPKKLFGSLLSTASKKPVRQGRVVASRYNQPSSAIRKIDNNNNESKRCEKKRSLSPEKKRRATVQENKNNAHTQRRIKKRWEIPSEIVIHGNYDDDNKSPQSVSVMHDLLPKLRVGRLPRESPRDSGPAKKVAQLIGRKSFFSSYEEIEPVCQSLCFAEEEDEM